jgi:hypothetical protein
VILAACAEDDDWIIEYGQPGALQSMIFAMMIYEGRSGDTREWLS